MKTTTINGKVFVVKLNNEFNCDRCSRRYQCFSTACCRFATVREPNVFEKIIMWFQKKIKK